MLLAQTIYCNSDITILGIIKGNYEVGLYSTSVKIYNLVNSTDVYKRQEHGCSLLSFKSEKYTDCVLDIQKGSQKYEVLSIYSPRYLAQNHYIDLNIGRCDYLKIRYEGTRIDCSLLEKKSGPDQLKESEYKDVYKRQITSV